MLQNIYKVKVFRYVLVALFILSAGFNLFLTHNVGNSTNKNASALSFVANDTVGSNKKDYTDTNLMLDKLPAYLSSNDTSFYDYGEGSLIGKEFKGLPKSKVESEQPFYGDPIDIDNDGNKEIVFYTIVAMTQRPHRAYIVKNNIIIFESDIKSRVHISESADKKGFYLEEYTMINTGNILVDAIKSTRYEYRGGVFNSSSSTVTPKAL